MRRLPVFLMLSLTAAAACDGSGASPSSPDATAVATPDAAPITTPDGAPADASMFPLAGFGDISGMCGVLTDPVLTDADPFYDEGHLDFGTDRYDDPADRSQLSPGGQSMMATPNAGGSSLYSEVFAYEILYRCDLAQLVATETEIQYTDPNSKLADMLVTIDGIPIGVSVTRAVTYPFGDPYTLDAATTLLTRKLSDIEDARSHAASGYQWGKSMVIAEAYDQQHADVYRQAWDMLDPSVKGGSIIVTDGDDLFIYTNQ